MRFSVLRRGFLFGLVIEEYRTTDKREWRERLLGEHHCKLIFKPSTARKSQRGISHAKARRRKDCSFIDFAPSRLCVRLFPLTFCTHGFSQKPDWWRSSRSVPMNANVDSVLDVVEMVRARNRGCRPAVVLSVVYRWVMCVLGVDVSA